MAEYNEYSDQYKVPVIAKLLHSLPHYNITFHRINNTFRPHDDIYLEVRFSPNQMQFKLNTNLEKLYNLLL